MSFLRNLSVFIEECRLYNRQCFTVYQWEYIKKVLESHQYMIELLGQFGGGFFDRLYDASVLRHDGFINHAHDKRYNSQKTMVLAKIKTLIQEAAGLETPWSLEQTLLVSGYYRSVLLSWDEIADDELLKDYVNFLFDEFEKGGSTTAYLVISVAVWAEKAIPKEPFLAALRDSQKAYEPRSNQSTYENKTYSCMIGLEDRISHFYSYLYSKEDLILEQQPLANRYIHAVLRPFIEPCAEQGFKPTPLLYGLYLKARFGSYIIIEKEELVPFLKIETQNYKALKKSYAAKNALILKNTLMRLFGAFHGLELRFAQCRHKELWLFHDIFLALQNEDGFIVICEDKIQPELERQFDRGCSAFCDEVVVNDYIAGKVENFGLESCIFSRRQVSKILILPDESNITSIPTEQVCLLLKESTCLTHDWIEMLQHLPVVSLLTVLESWVEGKNNNALPIEQLADELEKNLPLIESLEKQFFANSMSSMRRGELSYADYCYASDAVLDHIYQSIFMESLSINAYNSGLRAFLENGTMIFAQDSLTAKYLNEWLYVGSIQFQSVFQIYPEGELPYATTVAENIGFVSALIQLGFDETFKQLSITCSELVKSAVFIPALGDAPDSGGLVLECLGKRPMPSSVSYYLKNGGALRPPLSGHGDYKDAFYQGLMTGNLIFLNQFLAETSVAQILQGQQQGNIRSLIEAVIEARDPGVWAWFERYFSEHYHVFEKALPLRKHPILLTLQLPNCRWGEVNMIVKRFPDFLKKFIQRKKTRYPYKGVETFFDSFAEPLSYSIGNNPNAVSIFIKLPCYQAYLLDPRNFLIIEYIEQALKFRHLEAASLLVDEILEYFSERKGDLDTLRCTTIKKIHHIFKKEMIPLINATLYKKNAVSLKALQELNQKIEIITEPYAPENWIEGALMAAGPDMTLLKNKLDILQLKRDSLFLQKAIKTLWSKIQFASRDDIAILQLTGLLDYGYWPEAIDKKVIVRKLLRVRSAKQLIALLKLCEASEPSLIAEVLQCLSHDCYFNFDFLEKALVKALADNRLAVGDFYHIVELIEQYSDINNYSALLISYGWAYLWSVQRQKDPLATQLLVSILKLYSTDAQPLIHEIGALKITQEAAFFSLLQLQDSLPADGMILLLYAIKKINKTLQVHKKPCVLVEAVALRQFTFASYYVDKHPDLINTYYKNQSAFKSFMLSFDLSIIAWVVATPCYKEMLKEAWLTHTQRALTQECFDITEVLLGFAVANDCLTLEKAFHLWRVCQDYDKKDATEFLEYFIKRTCSASFLEIFGLKKREVSNMLCRVPCPVIFGNQTQQSSALVPKRRRKDSKEYIEFREK